MVVFRCVDLETAGLAPPASIIEIGYSDVVFDPDAKNVTSVTPPKAQLFRPNETLAPENIAVHHLTNEMLKGLPLCTAHDIRTMLTAGEPTMFVAAFAQFEQQWLTPEIVGERRWICTVKAAARLFPEAESHSNQAIRYRLGLVLDDALAMPPHRAGPDSYVTAQILANFLTRETARQLVQWTLEPRYMTKLPFGKHKGKLFTEAPADYLAWILKQTDMDADAQHWARVELERRRAA